MYPNYNLPTSGLPNFSTPGIDADTGNPTTVDQEVDSIEKKSKFDWGNVFGFGSSLIENSGQLASVFSPKYRQDQIELAQNQSWFSRNAPTFGQTPEQRKTNQNLIALSIVGVIVILILVFMMKKK